LRDTVAVSAGSVAPVDGHLSSSGHGVRRGSEETVWPPERRNVHIIARGTTKAGVRSSKTRACVCNLLLV